MSVLALARRAASNDATGPSTPGLPFLVGAATTTAFSVAWSPSSDVSGVAGYRVSIAVSPSTPARISAIAFDTVACAWSFSGLIPGTAYTVRVAAVDVYDNASNASATLTQSSAAASGAPSFYRVLNNEVGYKLQGYPLYGQSIGANATYRAQAAKADFLMLGAVNTNAFAAEETMVAAVRAVRAGVKLFKYSEPRYWYDGDGPASDSPYRESANVINLNSAPALWNARNAAGQQLGHGWSPSDTNGINWAVTGASLNGAGQTIQQAYRIQFLAMTQANLYDGVDLDDLNIVPVGNVIRGSSEEVDWSYLQDGVDYNRLTDYAFGDAWRAGIAALANEMRTIASNTFAVSFNSGIIFFYLNFKAPFSWSAGGRPPTPFASTAFNGINDVSFEENTFSSRAYGRRSGPNYAIAGDYTPLAAQIFMTFELHRQMTRPANDNRFSARIGNANAQMSIGIDVPSSALDIDFARSCWAMTKLIEGSSYGNVRNSQQPMFLDETCARLGAVVGGPRSMGTLNEPPNASNDPTSFTVRTENAANGAARFFWSEFDNALVVWRGDNTGITPGSGNFGDGSAATYTLPSAGSGSKWQRPNSATYVNPSFADLAMIGQNTTLNNGADASSSSLRPLHGELFLRVST